MKNAIKKLCMITGCAVLAGFSACSSAPKRPAEVFVIQNMTESQIQLAHKEADRGNYAEALNFLDEAWRLAVSTDRPVLRIRTAVSRGNVLFYLGKRDEAEEIWTNAEIEAAAAGENVLAAVCRIYRQRSALGAGQASPAEVRAAVQAELGVLKSDQLYAALAWTVTGLAEKEMGLFPEAETSLRNALSIHEGGRYLEQAGYDWYLIASVRSVSGDFTGALAALDFALGFDRRAENTYALAKDWAAKGEVFQKMGNEADAKASRRRAAEIFRSIQLENEAAAAEKQFVREAD